MESGLVPLLFATGLVGGVVTALVGGATLVTFPIMLMAGLPPVTAVASNLVALGPANFMAAMADRGRLPAFDRPVRWIMAGSFVAGAIGAAILLAMPVRTLEGIVPALIGMATLLFAFAEKIKRFVLRRRQNDTGDMRGVVVPSIAVSVYGGYFGAGLGVMYLSLFALGGISDLRTANALKNLVNALNSAAAIAIFIVSGSVDWHATSAMLVGGLIGGYGGGFAMRYISPIVFHRVVTAIGAVMTLVYAWRYWL
jgi:uncharacterized protein